MNAGMSVTAKNVTVVWAGLALILCVPLLFACTPTDTTDRFVYTGFRNTCRTNSDCETGTCHADLSVCVVAVQSPDAELLARVTFAASNLKPQLFSVPVVSTENYAFELRKPVAVQNMVLDIDADILFANLTDALPGNDPDVSVYRTYLTHTDFFLLPGMYRITIYPVGDDANTYPITSFSDIRMDENGLLWSGDDQVDFASALVNNTNVLSGKVSYAGTVESNVEARDLSVQAFDPVSHLALSRGYKLICRPGMSPAAPEDCGNFSIPLHKDISSVELRFFKPDEPFFVAYTTTIEGVGASAEIRSITLKPLEQPVLIQGTIGVNPGAGIQSVPPECHVLFKSVEPDRFLAYWARSNGYGEVERAEDAPGVYLYPGRYSVTAFPRNTNLEVSATAARTTFSKTLVVTNTPNDESTETGSDFAVNGFSFPLQTRLPIQGSVLFREQLMPQVQLTAYNISGNQPFNNVIRGISDANGDWRVRMDNDVYHLVAMPPEESGFAPGFHVWNILSSTSYRFEATVKIPFVIGGTVVIDTRDGFGNIQPDDVSIDWYQVSSQLAYPVAHTEVQSGFSFTALLPPDRPTETK